MTDSIQKVTAIDAVSAENLLDTKAVAGMIQIPHRRFMDMIRAGEGPRYVLFGKATRRFEIKDVQVWIEQNKKGA